MTQTSRKRKPAAKATPKAKPIPTAAARKRLWLFAQFLQTQNPEALAAECANLRKTLYHCAHVRSFFKRYVTALKAREAAR